MNLPPYDTFPQLYTGEYFLREITVNDLPGIIEISYYNGKPAANVGDVLDMLKQLNADYRNGTSINWGITNENDEVIGTCGFYRGFKNNCGEIGFVLKNTFRGKGYMTKSVNAIADFGFEVIGLEKLIAWTGHTNLKAQAVLEKAQFKRSNEQDEKYVKYERVKSN